MITSKFVYVTKYVLTRGIIRCKLLEDRGNAVTVDWPGGLNETNFFYGGQWHWTKAEAMKTAKKRRDDKVARLRRQAAKLKNYIPKIVNP